MVKLVYLPKTKRWHAFEGERYCCPLHCEDQICIRVKDRYFLAVVELDTKWYLLIDDVKFYLHPEQRYDAILMF
jgi:hypothetical protein